MKKQELERLQQLEEALMEETDTADVFTETELDLLEDTWQDVSETAYSVTNTDSVDVDLDAFSEDVHRGTQRNAFPICITILSLTLLFCMVLWLLHYLGVIG